MIALLALGLIGCYDDDRLVRIDPPAREGIALEEGAYEVQVLDVVSLACDGQRPADVVGQSLYGQLFREGDRAGLDLSGWFLEGSMEGGRLSLGGALVWDEPVPVDEDDTDVEDVPGAEEDADGDADAPPPGSGGSSADERPEEPQGWMQLEAAIVSERLASGTLAIEAPGCAMELEVAVLFAGGAHGGGEEPPVYEEPPVSEEPSEPCDGADCG